MMGGNNGSRKIRREYKSPITDGEALNLIFMQKIKKERYMISKCKELIQEQMSIGQDFIVVC